MAVDLLGEAGGAPEAVALVGKGASWTYSELDRAVSERADELRLRGHRAGTIVPVSMDTTADSVITLLALWRAGVAVAPLNPRLTPLEREAAARALSGRESAAQAVLWTSGTAGRPRGVAVSYDNLAASAVAARERLDLGPRDTWLASLSPAHIGGLALITRAVLLGSRLVAVGGFEAERALKWIDGEGLAGGAHGRGEDAPVTHLSVVPTQLLRLLDLRGDRRPPESFRCALVGGARAPSELLHRALSAGWPLAITYGLTEATSQVATAPPGLTMRKPGTVGEPLEGVSVRIADDGEILVAGATVALRGVGEEERPVTAEDGWLHTGDLGRVDEDGHLWVTGRRADRIVTGGVTVDAVEVEEALRAHSGVADVCVVGLPDPEWGERVAAWITPSGASLEAAELTAFLRERLSPSKIPRVLHIGGELPRNPNGKVDRAGVRDAVAAAQSDSSS